MPKGFVITENEAARLKAFSRFLNKLSEIPPHAAAVFTLIFESGCPPLGLYLKLVALNRAGYRAHCAGELFRDITEAAKKMKDGESDTVVTEGGNRLKIKIIDLSKKV
jgi:hypothetical protein